MAGLVTATGAVASTVTAPAANAATSSSQQWTTAVSSVNGSGVNAQRTFTFGNTGVTARQTFVSSFGGTCDMGASGLLGAGYDAFFEPDVPASTQSGGMQCDGNSGGTTDLTFNKPVLAPILHVVNLDASSLNVTGTPTTGGPIVRTPLAKNNALEISGATLNATRQDAINGGCAANDGGNPNGGCGSIQLTAASGMIQTVRLYNFTTNSGLTGGFAFDGWRFGLSFPTAPLTKQFDPAAIEAGGTSKLTFSLANPNNSGQPTTFDPLDFTDNLPAGLSLANGTTTDNGQCGANLAVTDAAGTALAPGATSVKAAGITLNKGETCEITVTVTSDTAGAYTNDSSNLSSSVANVVPNANTTLTVTQPWQCDAYGYLFQTNGAQTSPHTVTRIDLATGAATDVGETASYVNAVGYNTTDNYFYAWDVINNEIVKIDANLHQTALGLPAGLPAATYITGDFDDAGHYWITTNAAPNYYWAEIDYKQDSPTYGEVVQHGKITSGAQSIPSDWSYIGGKLYGVRSVNGSAEAHLVSFDPATDAIVDQGVLAGTTDPVRAGATYTDGTYLYGSDNATGGIYRIDPTTRQTILVSHGPASSGNDGARCATAQIPTITVTKTVDGRASGDDQFTVGIDNAAGNELTSATTSGTDTTVSTTNWPVSQGATYTITDAMADGSASAFDLYDASIECTVGNGAPVDVGGTTGAWTFAASEATDYACTITNTGKPKLEVTKSSDATDAARLGDTITYTVTAKNVGGNAYTAAKPATVVDDLTGVLDDGTYNGDAAVTGSTIDPSYAEPQISWSGPLAVGDTMTLKYSVTLNKDGDQDVANVAFQTDPCTDGNCPTPTPPAQCVDGADPATGLPCATTDLKLPKLTVVKSSQDIDTARIGDTVHYTVTATNTGQADYSASDPAQFADDLSGVLDDADYNGDAAIEAGGTGAVSFDASAEMLTWAGTLAKDESVTITYSVTVTGLGDLTVDNLAFETPACTADDCPAPTSPTQCDAGIDPATGLSCSPVTDGLPKLSITKISPELATARIGNTITYTITATNVGIKAFTTDTPAVVVDDLSGVLDDGTIGSMVTVKRDGSTWKFSTMFPGRHTSNGSTGEYRAPQLRWLGPLDPNESVEISYTVTLTGDGDGNIDNIAWQPENPDADCSLSSCTPPAPEQCTTGVNPATHLPCVELDQPLPRPEIAKAAPDLAAAHIGDAVTYTVTFTNAGPGDYTAERPALFADDLSALLDDATFDGSVTVNGSDAPAAYVDSQIVWSGPLAAGTSVTLTYSVVLTGLGDLNALNLAYVPPAPPACTGDACLPPAAPTPPMPGQCVDGANADTGLPCVVVKQDLPKLKLSKSSPDLVAAHIGDTVTYVVTATNVGRRDFGASDPALVLDDLTGVLDDAAFDGTVTVDGSDVAASYAEPRIYWSGPLAVGNTVTLTYSVMLTGVGDLDVANVAFAPPSPPACDAIDAADCPPYEPPTPKAGTCTDGVDSTTGLACAPLYGDLPKLDLAKTSPSLATASIGDTVEFTVTAKNIGKRAFGTADPAIVVDDLTGVLDDATFDGAVAVKGSTAKASYRKPRITWTGPLAMGDTVTLTYRVVLTGDGDMAVTNVAFMPPSPPACDALDAADCRPYDPPTPEQCADGVETATGLPCAVVSQDLRKLEITKTSDATGIVEIGDTVGYTVTAKNVGPGDYTADHPAVVVDDLTGVLDDATFDGTVTVAGSRVMASYVKPQIAWSGPLAAGDIVTLTYAVTVTGAGDLDLANVAFSPLPLDSGCVADGPCPVPNPKDCVDGASSVTGQPCAATDTPLPGLYVTKKVDKTRAAGGDTLTFTVTMANTGRVAFTADDPAVLTDDLSGVLDDATFNKDAAADIDGSLGVNDETLTWTGALAVGETVSVTYSVVVNEQASGDNMIDNVASIPGGITPRYPGGVCPDGAATCDPASPQAVTVSGVARSTTTTLPYTGTDTTARLAVAALLLLLGTGLALVGRRRRHMTA